MTVVLSPKNAGQFGSISLERGNMQSNEKYLYNLDNTQCHAYGIVMGLGIAHLANMSEGQKQTCYKLALAECDDKMRRKNTITGARYPYAYNATMGFTEARYGNGHKEMYIKANNGQMIAVMFGNELYAINLSGDIVARKTV